MAPDPYIADPLSEEILRGKFKEANKIVVSLKDGITAFQEEESDMLAKV
jgi:ATP-dependent Clp protease ATP-binding subunit ClpA